MLTCAAARAFASSLLDRRGHPGADGDIPAVSDVSGDFCRVPRGVTGCFCWWTGFPVHAFRLTVSVEFLSLFRL